MNRAFITPQNNLKIAGVTIGTLIAKVEERIPSMRVKGAHSTDLSIDLDGKRYSGKANMSAMGDVQWDIDTVDVVKDAAPAKKAATAKKAAPAKKAAKKK